MKNFVYTKEMKKLERTAPRSRYEQTIQTLLRFSTVSNGYVHICSTFNQRQQQLKNEQKGWKVIVGSRKQELSSIEEFDLEDELEEEIYRFRKHYIDGSSVWAHLLVSQSTEIKFTSMGANFGYDNCIDYKIPYVLKIHKVEGKKCICVATEEVFTDFDIGCFTPMEPICEGLKVTFEDFTEFSIYTGQVFVPDCFVKHISRENNGPNTTSEHFNKFSKSTNTERCYWDLAHMCNKHSQTLPLDTILTKQCRYGKNCKNYKLEHLTIFKHY